MSGYEYSFDGNFLSDITTKVKEAFPDYTVTVRNQVNNIVVVFDIVEELSPEDYATLSGVIESYDYDTSLLKINKTKKNELIDNRTKELIFKGFTFDGSKFSLSIEAQVSWLGLYTFRDMLDYSGDGYPVTTIDDEIYMVADANKMASFAGTGLTTIEIYKTSGRNLKAQVNSCTTIEQINAIIDDR